MSEPTLLPQGSRLLLAVSGGQDSMALVALLVDLQRIHKWEIHLWHGNHNWQTNSELVSNQLQKWCKNKNLTLQIDSADQTINKTEDAARAWRYNQLERTASALKADVVTGHTGSDQAETIILQLARGSDLAGLSGMRHQRQLNSKGEISVKLLRPMLTFSREDTFNICKELELPTWVDPSNQSPLHARNRIRHEVLPILGDLYPGCTMRLASLAKRTSKVRDIQTELTEEVLKKITIEGGLDRHELGILSKSTRQVMLYQWIKNNQISPPNSIILEKLSERLEEGKHKGRCNIGKGNSIAWERNIVFISQT